MIVSEFIEWLKTQDQGATVQIVVGESSGYSTYTTFRDFKVEEHNWYYYSGLRILELGDD